MAEFARIKVEPPEVGNNASSCDNRIGGPGSRSSGNPGSSSNPKVHVHSRSSMSSAMSTISSADSLDNIGRRVQQRMAAKGPPPRTTIPIDAPSYRRLSGPSSVSSGPIPSLLRHNSVGEKANYSNTRNPSSQPASANSAKQPNIRAESSDLRGQVQGQGQPLKKSDDDIRRRLSNGNQIPVRRHTVTNEEGLPPASGRNREAEERGRDWNRNRNGIRDRSSESRNRANDRENHDRDRVRHASSHSQDSQQNDNNFRQDYRDWTRGSNNNSPYRNRNFSQGRRVAESRYMDCYHQVNRIQRDQYTMKAEVREYKVQMSHRHDEYDDAIHHLNVRQDEHAFHLTQLQRRDQDKEKRLRELTLKVQRQEQLQRSFGSDNRSSYTNSNANVNANPSAHSPPHVEGYKCPRCGKHYVNKSYIRKHMTTSACRPQNGVGGSGGGGGGGGGNASGIRANGGGGAENRRQSTSAESTYVRYAERGRRPRWYEEPGEPLPFNVTSRLPKRPRR